MSKPHLSWEPCAFFGALAIMLPINDKTRRWNMPCEGRRGPDAVWRLSMRESHSCRECEGTAGPACT